ncbi:GGDEF domain-containing protein [Harryflintia acetispora]|uniref:GGDEF domain-containing protein n=1 Tax=Harryflintia acetispora TaxID=1849041 RepID=A0A9X8UHJ9_9FIRM|nr:diguanylate cyclase [Harryflintia acetispora]TCL41900.1 GGDEF domain-containing protein [Harryflintia acetispora]
MKNRSSLVADLSFLFMLLLMFVCILFLAGDQDNIWTNCAVLAVATGVVIVTYFTSLVTGLICNLVLIFGYVTFIIVTALYGGGGVPGYVYFWILWTPAMTVAVHLFTHYTARLDQENEKLRRQLTKLSGVDTLTELKNMRGFERDATVYMKISRRYNMELMLIVWEFRYQRELRQIIGAQNLERVVQQVSGAISSSLRAEDAVYLLSDDPYAWGTLLFTNAESVHVVIERVESRIRQIELRDMSGKHDIYLDMRVGSASLDEKTDSPLLFLEQARRQSEYDVS